MNVGDSKNFMTMLANKVTVKGFGLIVDRTEIQNTTPGNTTTTSLHVTLQHYDYNNLVSQSLHNTHFIELTQ